MSERPQPTWLERELAFGFRFVSSVLAQIIFRECIVPHLYLDAAPLNGIAPWVGTLPFYELWIYLVGYEALEFKRFIALTFAPLLLVNLAFGVCDKGNCESGLARKSSPPCCC